MATIAEVVCIHMRQHPNPHQRVAHIGVLNQDGTRWKLAESAAIIGIESGQYGFYVNVGGKHVMVEVATHDEHKYLKTVADSYAPNTLLCLPECQ
jgi:hypothetical protein